MEMNILIKASIMKGLNMHLGCFFYCSSSLIEKHGGWSASGSEFSSLLILESALELLFIHRIIVNQDLVNIHIDVEKLSWIALTIIILKVACLIKLNILTFSLLNNLQMSILLFRFLVELNIHIFHLINRFILIIQQWIYNVLDFTQSFIGLLGIILLLVIKFFVFGMIFFII